MFKAEVEFIRFSSNFSIVEMPLTWIQDNNETFLKDLTLDDSRSLVVLAQLMENKQAFIK